MPELKSKYEWGHININVQDLERSIAFYELLGFTVFVPGIPYLNLDAALPPQKLSTDMASALGVPYDVCGRSVIMQLGDCFPKIDLTEFRGVEGSPPLENTDLGLVRLCLIAHNLREDVDFLRAKGVEFVAEIKTGYNQLADLAICKDPDGTLIELLQPYLDRPWTIPMRD